MFFEEGNDMGTADFMSWNMNQLKDYLGLTGDGLPFSFRRYTHEDPSALKDSDVEVTDSEPVRILWHQLVAVAAILRHSTRSEVSSKMEGILHTMPYDSAPRSIREEWGKHPGFAILDEVGLGKTMCAIALIATFQTIINFQNTTASG